MTLSRRLAKIEESLSPTQLVLRWLAEAHVFGDVPAYVASLLAKDPPVAPLDHLARQAVQGATASMRGKRPELANAAVRSALRETVFRYELVLRINVTAHELLDREGLIDAALSAQVALVASLDKPERKDIEWLGQLPRSAPVPGRRAACDAGARTLVQERYLDGHAALFPYVAAAWEEQVKSTTVIADMAVRLAELDGAPTAAPTDPEAVSRRAAELFADVVEPAKSDALEKLGDGERAYGIAIAWLRTKFATVPPVGPDAPAP
jgi:hypothetical protein